MHAFVKLIVIGLTLVPFRLLAAADAPHSTLAFWEREEKAREKCLSISYQEPPVTFNAPHGAEAKMYHTNLIPTLSFFGVYKPIFFDFTDELQSFFIQGEAENMELKITHLGDEAERFARTRDYNDFQSACVAACISNTLMKDAEDVMPFTSLTTALSQGVGDCKVFAVTTQLIMKQMNLNTGVVMSWTDAFNTITTEGHRYYFDPSWGTEPSCNFIEQK